MTIAMKAVTFVGANRAAYLPAWIPVSIRIVNHSRVRSYRKVALMTRSTYHDTGNPRTRAEGEYAWLAGGRVGGELGGYNLIFDDGIIIQCVPLDEDTWHAGTPAGNATSWGSEHAFGGGVSWTKSLEVGAALHGALLEMADRPPTAAVLHQFWYGKWCSAQILNRGIWPTVLEMIATAWQRSRNARLAAAGQPVPGPDPAPAYAPGILPRRDDGSIWDGTDVLVANGVTFYPQKLTTTTTVALRRRQWGNTDSLETGPVVPAGGSVDLLGWVAGELVDGISEWWIGSGGSRLWAGGIAATPAQVPDYGEHPDDGPGVALINGRLYYPLVDPETGTQGRKLIVTGPTTVRRWADVDSAAEGERKAGDEVTAYWWALGSEVRSEPVWYVLQESAVAPGGRVWAGDTDDRPK